jgi:hypothetical protein
MSDRAVDAPPFSPAGISPKKPACFVGVPQELVLALPVSEAAAVSCTTPSFGAASLDDAAGASNASRSNGRAVLEDGGVAWSVCSDPF